jgi:hypothetical protein
VGGVIVAVKVPLALVVPWLVLIVPSLEVSVTATPDAGLPLLLTAETAICHGPFAGPPSTGVPIMTREPLDELEDVIVIASVPDFVESWLEVAFTVAMPEAGAAGGAV